MQMEEIGPCNDCSTATGLFHESGVCLDCYTKRHNHMKERLDRLYKVLEAAETFDDKAAPLLKGDSWELWVSLSETIREFREWEAGE